MLRDSILVVAHPDDEALWFSSILDRVGEIVVCFLGSRTNPEWKARRERCMAAYPLDNICTLGLEQAGVFNSADWREGTTSSFGMEIQKSGPARDHYMENFRRLKSLLERKLEGRHNVFTHNPWGEYGHEEHVQVYRAVKELQEQQGFDLWFTNCCSNRSYNLMLTHIAGFDTEYVTLPANKKLGEAARSLYQKHNCWTWYDDYCWFSEESFMRDRKLAEHEEDPGYGRIFPLNFIKMEIGDGSKTKGEETSLLGRIGGKLRRIGEAVGR